MIGLIYLILCFSVGWSICAYAFPDLCNLVETDYMKRKISVSPYILLLPAWYATGTLALTWATYLTAYVFQNAPVGTRMNEKPSAKRGNAGASRTVSQRAVEGASMQGASRSVEARVFATG